MILSQNGWLSIITIPYRTILGDLRELAIIFGGGIYGLFDIHYNYEYQGIPFEP